MVYMERTCRNYSPVLVDARIDILLVKLELEGDYQIKSNASFRGIICKEFKVEFISYSNEMNFQIHLGNKIKNWLL